METMTRGEVAEEAGVTRDTVLFYERKGLIPPPRRSDGGYRTYSNEYVDRIRFVKRAQDLGFTLSEVAELLSLRLDPDSDCGDVKLRAKGKLAGVEKKIGDLERIRSVLQRLTNACSGEGPTSECPILEALRPESGG